MNSIACLIDPLDTNGYVIAWAVADGPDEAVSALKEGVVGKTFRTMEMGDFTVDEDVWDRLRATYDGDLDGDSEDCAGLILEVHGT